MAPTDVAVVALADVTKKFGGAIAANNVSLQLHAGKVLSLVGENGAGKSTLMKIIAGVQPPDTGSVLLYGEPVSFSTARQAEAAGITMIPQELDLFNELSVAENLFIGRARPRTRIGGIDYLAMAKQTREIFAELQLDIDPGVAVGSLRAAARQLVAIARALVTDTAVLILDEPTAALTDTEAQTLLTLVRQLAARGTAVVYVSHRLDEIFAISDVITVLRDGSVIDSLPPAELDETRLVKLMVGRDVNHLYTRSRREPGEVVLSTSSLSRTGDFSDINLTVRAGEILGISGLIGAGRTEFAHALVGVTRPTGGTFELLRQQRKFSSPREAMDAGIGYVPEERRSEGLVLEFSVGENITYSSLPAISRGGLVNVRAERSIVKTQVKALGIKARRPSTSVSLLSGGNQQKVVLAKALVTRPKLLILDEPTRGVDVGAKAEIYALIDDLAKQGTAIILISSELPEVLSMSDRVAVMRQGRVVVEFTHEQATAELIGAAQAGAAEVTEKDFNA
jgi:ABC-type sugar transport system ATPase subunit